MQISDTLIRRLRCNETIKKRASSVLRTLMSRRTMVSNISFQNTKVVFNTPHMDVTTALVSFTKSSGAGQIYISLVDGSYKVHNRRITRIASAQATLIGMMKPLYPHRQFIQHISIVPILGPALIHLQMSSSKQVWL